MIDYHAFPISCIIVPYFGNILWGNLHMNSVPPSPAGIDQLHTPSIQLGLFAFGKNRSRILCMRFVLIRFDSVQLHMAYNVPSLNHPGTAPFHTANN